MLLCRPPAGTGDDIGDAAFDLRLLHYLTGGVSDTGNPYWDIVAPLVRERDGRWVADGGSPTGSPRLAYAQTILQAAYAYAIPAPATVAWTARRGAGRPVVEIGAGRGYWAHQLANAGVEVAAYDYAPPSEQRNLSFPAKAGVRDVWHPVDSVTDMAMLLPPARDAVLLLCWPPGWGDPMASTTLAEFERAGGRDLVYVGEPKGGKTGDAPLFDALAARWSPAARDERFVSWWNLADSAHWWTRRT